MGKKRPSNSGGNMSIPNNLPELIIRAVTEIIHAISIFINRKSENKKKETS
jgi:hypothetical protein